MKHKIILNAIILSVIILAALTIVSCDSFSCWFFGEPTEICEGFSYELTGSLADRYQITIPQEAIFIKGINTNAFRDPSVVILFECPLNEIPSMDDNLGLDFVFRALSLDESRYSYGGRDEKIFADWFDELGGMLDYKIVDKNDHHTFISYSFGENVLRIRFVGRHPGKTFD